MEYLIPKGIKQYTQPLPSRKVFDERQRGGFNYALYDQGKPAGIVSLIPNYVQDEWKGSITDERYLWVSSLFVSKEYKGHHIDEHILGHIENHAVDNNYHVILLDCYLGDGFLLNYYAKNGYKEIGRKTFKYPNREFEAVLMRKVI